MDVGIPRDRKGELQPQVVKKYQNTVTQDMEEKISRITDKILPLVREWQERSLEEV